MACGSGCCAPPPPENMAQSSDAGPAEQVGETSHAGDSGAVAVNVQQASAVDKEAEANGKCRSGIAIDQDSCQDGCCCDKKTATVVVDEDACNDGCCEVEKSSKVTDYQRVDMCLEDGCCGDEEAKIPEVGDCCDDDGGCCTAEEGSTPVVETCQDACCAEEGIYKASKESSDAGCEDACCSSDKTATKKSDAPACCDGKPSPCCDVSCLDRLADRECEEQSNGKLPKGLLCAAIQVTPRLKQLIHKVSPTHPPLDVAIPRAKADSHARSTSDPSVKSTPPSWRPWAASAVLCWRWARNRAARRRPSLRLRGSAAPRRMCQRSQASLSTRAVPRVSPLGAQLLQCAPELQVVVSAP